MFIEHCLSLTLMVDLAIMGTKRFISSQLPRFDTRGKHTNETHNGTICLTYNGHMVNKLFHSQMVNRLKS